VFLDSVVGPAGWWETAGFGRAADLAPAACWPAALKPIPHNAIAAIALAKDFMLVSPDRRIGGSATGSKEYRSVRTRHGALCRLRMSSIVRGLIPGQTPYPLLHAAVRLPVQELPPRVRNARPTAGYARTCLPRVRRSRSRAIAVNVCRRYRGVARGGGERFTPASDREAARCGHRGRRVPTEA